jgi:hypothetical protein
VPPPMRWSHPVCPYEYSNVAGYGHAGSRDARHQWTDRRTHIAPTMSSVATRIATAAMGPSVCCRLRSSMKISSGDLV